MASDLEISVISKVKLETAPTHSLVKGAVLRGSP